MARAPTALAPVPPAGDRGRLQLSLQRPDELFDAGDPAPLYAKQLDPRVEHFLVTSLGESQAQADLHLTLHLQERPPPTQPGQWLGMAIRRHFAGCADLIEDELRTLAHEAQLSFGVGMGFLLACAVAAQFVRVHDAAAALYLFGAGLVIAGWMALWRPLRIWLREYRPGHARQRLFGRLARMPVEVRTESLLAEAV